MATFALDPAHSSVDFTVRHMVFSRVRGSFQKFSVNLEVDDATNLPIAVSATIDATSIDTNVADRDAHLKSPDFLDAEKFPAIEFLSTKISGSPDAYTVDGTLTIHGVTRPISLKATVDGRGKDPWGNDRIAYSATAKINRKDFGLTWNQALETGGVLVGEELEIALTIQAVNAKQPAVA
ncbi:MAG TPA: YceI family protein [Candidatus Acidoferrales bacterium]|nr:YceI family protein [Candidatus Acidoferrales bacterium]